MQEASESSGNTKRYAVTGAGGFVGGQLANHLLDEGHEVVAIVRDASQAEALAARGASIKLADIRNTDELTTVLDACDGVFHLAALFNNPDKSWDDYREVNVQGSINVVNAAKKLGIDRVVHCSTVGVATEAEPPPYSERTPYSPQPDDKYEITKCEAEQAFIKTAKENNVSFSVIRPAQVYGPGDRSKAKFYKLVKKGIIVSPGKTRKHLIHVDDLCRSFVLAMQHPAADGEIFLIAGDSSIALTELISMVAATLNVSEPRIRLPAWPVTFACGAVEVACNTIGIKPVLFKRSMDFFTRTVECDTTKARSVLGFSSQVSVAEGVGQTANWYKQEGII